ncbi:MAG: hypothetical protein V1672_03965 [Candidatus Diapherotrites archaeon]
MSKLSELIERNAGKAFLFVLLLGIVSRIISFLILPEATYTDAVYHLAIVKDILQTGLTEEILQILPMPLYHFILVIFFGLTALPLDMPFLRIMPFIISVLQIVFAYLVCKELFPENKTLQLMGIAFTAAHAVIVIFSAVNYTGPIATLFVLISFYLLIRIKKSTKVTNFHLCLFVISVFLLSLTKMNATFTIPAFLVGLFFVLREKNVPMLKISGIIFVIVLLSLLWFAFNFFTTGNALGFSSGDVEAVNVGVFETNGLFETNITIEKAVFFYFYFWYFPSLTLFPQMGLSDSLLILTLAGVFALAILPLGLLILKGIHNSLKEKNLIYLTMLLSILMILPILIIRGFETRMLLPVLPLFGLFAVSAYSKLNNVTFRSLAVLSFVFFGMFSFVYVSGSAVYFSDQHSKVTGLYEFISELPDDVKIISKTEFRRISFYSGKNSRPLKDLSESTTPSQFISAATDEGFTHLAVTCIDDYPLSVDLFVSLLEDNEITEVYSDECTALYQLNK